MTDEPRRAAPEQPPARPPSRLAKAKKAYDLVSDIVTPGRLLVAAAGALVLVVGLIGGWENVAAVEEEIPSVEASAAATATPFELTLRRARHATELQPIAYTEDGIRYLFVSADVTLHSDQPVDTSVLVDAVTIDADGLKATYGTIPRPTIYRLNDALTPRSLQPEVVTPVVLVWQQDASVPLPAEVTVTLNEQEWAKSSLEDAFIWRAPTPVAQVVLAVEDLEPAS